MTRPHRRVIPGVPHHVVHRGNNRRHIASHAFDYWRLLEFIADAAERWRCSVHAVALMSNHLHLLVTPPEEDALPRLVQSFAQRYAEFRNRQRRATGKLFEQRYFSIALQNDVAVGCVTSYIDLNPVRARQVATPDAHRWTTARLHLGHEPSPDWPPTLWTPSKWYLELGDTAMERAVAYVQWLESSPSFAPAHTETLSGVEALSSLHYGLRLRRPDGKRAAEPGVEYGFDDRVVVMGQE